MLRKGPDSLEGWCIAFICCLLTFLMDGTVSLSSLLFVACQSRYNTDRKNASFPFMLTSVMQALTGPFVGYLAKRHSDRAVLLAGNVLTCVGIGTCFFAESITVISILWGVVFGLGYGFSTVLLPAIINNVFFKYRATALGICYLGSPIGFMVLPPVVEKLLNVYGLSGTFLFLCAICMQSAPLSLMLRQPEFHRETAVRDMKDDYHFSNRLNKPDMNSSTGSVQHPSSQTEVKYDDSNASLLRRYSLESSMVYGSSLRECRERTKQYTLNQKCYGTNCKTHEYTRSYEGTGRVYCEGLNRTCCILKNSALRLHDKEFNEALSASAINVSSVCGCRIKRVNITSLDVAMGVKSEGKENGLSKESNQFSSTSFETYQKHRDIDGHFSPVSESSNVQLYVKSHNDVSSKCSLTAESFCNNCMTTTNSLLPLVSETKQCTAESSKNQFTNCKDTDSGKTSDNLNRSLMSIYCDPVFILMSIVKALFSFQFNAMSTVILDFARDHAIDSSSDKFILMCLAVMGLCGMMAFGWVTDSGYMSRSRFSSMMLILGSISVAVLPMTAGFTMLIALLSLWSVTQSSFVVLIPVIIAEYFDEDTQAVAVSASTLLCAPFNLMAPPLIGKILDLKIFFNKWFSTVYHLHTPLKSISVAVLPLTAGFTMLIALLSLWSVTQSSFVVLIPVIIAEYFDEDTQAVAVSASTLLCAPFNLMAPPLIGYFRDGQGSYDNLFYLFTAMALINSVIVLIVPYAARKQKHAETTRL